MNAAAARPSWLDAPPRPDAAYLYVVGAGSGDSVSDAQAVALKDAIGQIASQISVTITARTISSMSTKAEGDVVLSDSRSSVRARVQEAQAVGEPWVETTKRGIWPFRRPKRFAVRVLVRYPRSALARERARQESVWSDYKTAVDHLAGELAREASRTGAAPMAVGAFAEAATKRSYAFGEIIQRDLSDALTRAGARLASLAKANLVVTGAYREIGGQVVVTTRLVRVPGEPIAVAEAAFDRDAIPDQWLEIVTPSENFFDGTEPQRARTDARYGTISVQASPQDVAPQIFIDGDLRGKAPAALGGIPVGLRSVTVAAPGFEPFIQQVRVAEAETRTIVAKLKPLTGRLEVRSAPPGAAVFDGSRLLGETPLKLTDLPLGAMRLTLKLEDHEDKLVEALIEAKKTTVLSETLTEQPGSLLVMSDPPGAEISIDGVEVGTAKAPKFLKIERIAAGAHKVTARKKGVGVWGGDVTIRSNKTETINAVLTNSLGILAISIIPHDARVIVDGQAVEDTVADPEHGNVSNVDDLLKKLPGLDGHVTGPSRALTIEELRSNAGGGRFAIPLEAGEHLITISALGYQGEQRELSIKPGKIKRLRLELIAAPEDRLYVNGPGNHLFGELMPWTKKYVDMCRRGDATVGVKVAACTLTFPVATLMTLGLYPLVGDIVTFPYHAVRAAGRRLPAREEENHP